jgi:hypothetical protein
LREAGKVLQIELLDHVIVGDVKSDPQGRGFFSFREPATCKIRALWRAFFRPSSGSKNPLRHRKRRRISV